MRTRKTAREIDFQGVEKLSGATCVTLAQLPGFWPEPFRLTSTADCVVVVAALPGRPQTDLTQPTPPWPGLAWPGLAWGRNPRAGHRRGLCNVNSKEMEFGVDYLFT
ncbi:hypothetical protein RUM43_008657 [Polyplax serrata]|uniref:Uncharacterized protein n=1 Tax=Polyplax serrata TaxID=468196 RepID=A0AAN8PVA5_POLSC